MLQPPIRISRQGKKILDMRVAPGKRGTVVDVRDTSIISKQSSQTLWFNPRTCSSNVVVYFDGT
jgi:hypothetical protein